MVAKMKAFRLACGAGFLALLAVSWTQGEPPSANPAKGSPGTATTATPAPLGAGGAPVITQVAPAPLALNLGDLIRIGVEQNPRLAQATFAIETARGQATQAGLYPNPTVALLFDELGDRQGAAGVNTLPLVTQEIVLGGKLRLSQAAALKGVDQATLDLVSRRYALLGEIRAAYVDVIGLQQRVELLRYLLKLADGSLDTVRKLQEVKEASRLDQVQLEVEQERVRADLEAAEQELPGAYRRLAAVVGVNALPICSVTGTFAQPAPPYDLEKVRRHVLEVHPDIHAARVAIDRAQLLVQRQQAEPIPNLTLSGGYVRQSQNRSNDVTVGISIPVPLWNRNQGNIAAAQGQFGEAVQRVGQVENELVERVAQAHRELAAAAQRAERYRTAVLPRAQETYELSLKAYRLGLTQVEYLRVFEAQRLLGQAALEYLRAQQDGWKAAAQISGLSLEEHWPPAPPVLPKALPAKSETLPAPREKGLEKKGNDKERPPEELAAPRKNP